MKRLWASSVLRRDGCKDHNHLKCRITDGLFLFVRYIDYVREDQLRQALGRLLWGFGELLDEVYALHLNGLISSLPRIPSELALSDVQIRRQILSLPGATSDVHSGLQGGHWVALKVIRLYGVPEWEVGRQVIEVCAY